MLIHMKFSIKTRIISVVVLSLIMGIFMSQAVCAAPEETLDLASLAEEQDKLDKELADIMTDIKKTDKDREKCSTELKSAQADVDSQYDAMSNRIRYLYEEGDVSMMNMLCGAKSMADFINKAEYVSTINTYDRSKMKELQDARQVVQDKQDKLTSKIRKLKKLKKARVAKQKELAKKIEKSLAALAARAGASLTFPAGSSGTGSQPSLNLPSDSSPVTFQTNSGTYTWNGSVLTRAAGVNKGPSGMETYYNLNMSGVISIMRSMGNKDKYWVRKDGVKMLGDYVMVGADFKKHPRGSIVDTSLGKGIVVDTGYFYYKKQLDIATAW